VPGRRERDDHLAAQTTEKSGNQLALSTRQPTLGKEIVCELKNPFCQSDL
jgi:hypothetical protein